MISARRAVMLVVVLLSGCTPALRTRRQFELWKQSYQILKFDSATALVVVMHRAGGEDASRVWNGILELGGPVETVRGDTLIIEPQYIIEARRTRSGDLEIARIDDARVLPDLVFVPAVLGFHLESFSDERRKRSWRSVFVNLGLVALLLCICWPRG